MTQQRTPRPARRGRPRGSASTTADALGSILPGELLPLAEFRRRMGIGNKGFAAMRRAGLKVRRFGRAGYVLGADAIAWFEGLPVDDGAGGDE